MTQFSDTETCGWISMSGMIYLFQALLVDTSRSVDQNT
jgi:hypothetical protein